MCDGKNHPLINIISFEDAWKVSASVKWCPDCGAIVVDGEHDGRTRPGHFVRMKFPKAAKEMFKQKRKHKKHIVGS